MFSHDDPKERMGRYRKLVSHYVESVNNKSLEDVLSLFAENAEIHDPVGLRQFRGKRELRKFYEGVIQRARLEIVGPLRGSWGNSVAASLVARVPGFEIDVITVTTFDGDGLIEHYSAYWDEVNKRPCD